MKMRKRTRTVLKEKPGKNGIDFITMIIPPGKTVADWRMMRAMVKTIEEEMKYDKDRKNRI